MTDEDLQAILDNHSRSIEACLNLMRGQNERFRLVWTVLTIAAVALASLFLVVVLK